MTQLLSHDTSTVLSKQCLEHLEKILKELRQALTTGAHLKADSRKILPGDIFIAYIFGSADNRHYIKEAIQKGAAAVIWDNKNFVWPDDEVTQNIQNYAVPDLNNVIGLVASAWYEHPSQKMKVVGITGSNGKTSCSHWLSELLTQHAHIPCGIVGTLGAGLWGQLTATGFTTPDAIQLQQALKKIHDQGCQAAAIEVSSHALDQRRVDGTRFDTAVFTNLTQDHLDYHGTMANYETAKARLFAWPHLNCAVINRDDAMGEKLLSELEKNSSIRLIEYSIQEDNKESFSQEHRDALYAKKIRVSAKGTRFEIEAFLKGQLYQHTVHTALLGKFNISNLLAVLGSALALDVPFDIAAASLSKLSAVPGRMEEYREQGKPLVIVDYAHTPDALEQVLTELSPLAEDKGGQLICVFGCGGQRDTSKRPIMGKIAERLAAQVVITSDNPRNESPQAIIQAILNGFVHPEKARYIEDRASAILQTIRHAQASDVILIAGKGHENTQEIAGQKYHFSDAEHVRIALESRSGANV